MSQTGEFIDCTLNLTLKSLTYEMSQIFFFFKEMDDFIDTLYKMFIEKNKVFMFLLYHI